MLEYAIVVMATLIVVLLFYIIRQHHEIKDLLSDQYIVITGKIEKNERLIYDESIRLTKDIFKAADKINGRIDKQEQQFSVYQESSIKQQQETGQANVDLLREWIMGEEKER